MSSRNFTVIPDHFHHNLLFWFLSIFIGSRRTMTIRTGRERGNHRISAMISKSWLFRYWLANSLTAFQEKNLPRSKNSRDSSLIFRALFKISKMDHISYRGLGYYKGKLDLVLCCQWSWNPPDQFRWSSTSPVADRRIPKVGKRAGVPIFQRPSR